VVRLFHWSLAAAVLLNFFVTEEGEGWHEALGYYAAAWLAIRIVWGFVARGAARWSDFWPTPPRVGAHGRALVRGEPLHRLGHSPLGAVVMIAMMAGVAGLGLSGFLMQEVDAFWGDERLEDLHELVANAVIALASLHVLAAIVESVRLRDNLPLSMITGRRRPLPGADDSRPA
jgi:cytochrome b